MAKQVQKHLAFAYSLLRKDARLCALFVGSSLNVISIVAGQRGRNRRQRAGAVDRHSARDAHFCTAEH